MPRPIVCRSLLARSLFLAIALSCVGTCALAIAADPVDIVFQANVDQTEQRYVLIAPDSPSATGIDVLIALHGHGSDRWQFATGQLAEGRAARDIAAKYAMLYVSPDYRAKTSWMGPKAEADVQQIIAELKAKYPVRRVFLSGASMGGTSVLTYAAIHPDDVDGVISMNGTANHLEYERFQEAISASFGGSKVEIPAEYKKRSGEYWPERFTMPVGFTTGGRDTIVPPESVTRLANILKRLDRPVRQIHREAGGHSTTYEDAIEAFEFVIQAAQ